VAQLDPEPNYDHRLAERVVTYLQTGDWRLFPFAQVFDASQRRAFVHDLREGLSELTDSGSARKSSATGFPMNDRRLLEVVREWAAAKGDWPSGANASNPVTALGSVPRADDPPFE